MTHVITKHFYEQIKKVIWLIVQLDKDYILTELCLGTFYFEIAKRKSYILWKDLETKILALEAS